MAYPIEGPTDSVTEKNPAQQWLEDFTSEPGFAAPLLNDEPLMGRSWARPRGSKKPHLEVSLKLPGIGTWEEGGGFAGRVETEAVNVVECHKSPAGGPGERWVAEVRQAPERRIVVELQPVVLLAALQGHLPPARWLALPFQGKPIKRRPLAYGGPRPVKGPRKGPEIDGKREKGGRSGEDGSRHLCRHVEEGRTSFPAVGLPIEAAGYQHSPSKGA